MKSTIKTLLAGNLLLLLSISVALGQPAAKPAAHDPDFTPTPLEARRKTLNDLFHEQWEASLKYSPETASFIGDKRYNDRLTDFSTSARNSWLARERDFLQRLGQIDVTGLSEQEQLSRDLLARDLTEEQEESTFKSWEMPLDQENGYHVQLPALVETLSFDTLQDYDDYIARLKAVPRAFSQIEANMLLGIDDRRTPPKYLMEKVLTQVNGVITQLSADKVKTSSFCQPLQRFPKSISAAQQATVTERLLTTIQESVLPAYSRLGKFLSSQYIPAARSDPGVWSVTDGDAYYAFLARKNTTTSLTPEQIHKLGIAQVAEIEPQLLALVTKLGYKDLHSFHTALTNDPKLAARVHVANGGEIRALYQHYEDQMRPRLPQLFNHIPLTPLAVVTMTAAGSSDQVPADYQGGTPDGKRPGWVRVNETDAAKRLTTQIEAIAYHEGLPGHHLQISIAQELTGLPEFRKFEGYTAFVEGWALYSERLGKEVGFYQDPLSEYGRLENEMWRAVRLVVDTGVHSKHWTRDQMVQYFHDHTAMDEITVQTEVDRYIAWPGQALSYKIGQLKIIELRQHAQTALGAKFDIRAFHDEVLSAGALPLDLLSTRIDRWISAQQSGKP